MTICEIEKILNHRKNPRYEFLVKFVDYDEPEWIIDSDCYCEKEINDYLSDLNPPVRTVYVFGKLSQPVYVDHDLTGPNPRVKYVSQKELEDVAVIAKRDDQVFFYDEEYCNDIGDFISVVNKMHNNGVYVKFRDIWYCDGKRNFIRTIIDM